MPLISVRTEVVLETLVGSIADAVARRIDEPLPDETEAALAIAGDEPRRRLARAGYHARAVELERFEPARDAMPWLQSDRPPGIVAAELAAREPVERPDPDDDRAITWKVPGPGGHVRHYLALRAAASYPALEPADAKRAWVTGFLVRCLEQCERIGEP